MATPTRGAKKTAAKRARKSPAKGAAKPAAAASVVAASPPAAPPSARGARTRQHLKEACARVLERMGYRDMRVRDITDEAGVPISLFYHYFDDKQALTMEILQEMLREMAAEVTSVATAAAASDNEFLQIEIPTATLARRYAERPGLMRCLLQFEESEAAFAEIYRRESEAWSHRIARHMGRKFAQADLSDNQRYAVASALGGMVDRFLHDVYVQPYPELSELFPTADDAARMLSALWHRILYLENPPPTKLRGLKLLAGLDKKPV